MAVKAKRRKATPKIARRSVEVINDWGLHARPAAAIATEASKYDSDIVISHGKHSANAQSIAALLMLEAVKGTQLEIAADGSDADQAIAAIEEIFTSGFGEEYVILTGQGSKAGTVVGTAHVLYDSPDDVLHYAIKKASIPKEYARLAKAIATVKKEYKALTKNSDDPQIVEFQKLLLAMLKEEHVTKLPKTYIKADLINAEWALKISIEEITEQFRKRDEPVWQNRAQEYEQMLDRLIAALRTNRHRRKKSTAGAKQIIVTNNIGPAEVLEYYNAGYIGFVATGGSFNSHAAILARSLGMPAILAIENKALAQISEDAVLGLDSDSSKLHVKPTKDALEELRIQTKQTPKRPRRKVMPAKEAHTVSLDGVNLQVLANIEFVEEIELALRNGAVGIGLFRTEFFFLQKATPPTEEEQFTFYRDIIKKLKKRPVTFRTLDVGHDKMMAVPDADESPLGTRGIRLSLQDPNLFKVQIRAMLRASKYGDISIMLPMIGQVAEFERAYAYFLDAAKELGIKAADLPPLGAMIEIPGTVYILEDLAQKCDFFSIGSNDLIQYTLAVDRNNAQLAELADPWHPGVIALIRQIITKSVDLKVPLTMCGELAADPTMVKLFTALGLRNLSMIPAKMLEIRDTLSNYNIAANTLLADQITSSASMTEIKELVHQLDAC